MSVFLNGVSQADLGLVMIEGAPAVSGFSRARETLAWPGRTGGIASPLSTTEPRVLRFVWQGRPTMTISERHTILRRLSALLTGRVEVVIADGTPRRIVGMVTRNDATMTSPTFVNHFPTITIEITCPNAAFEDVEPVQYLGSSTPVRLPVGTAGHTVQFIIPGANSGPFTITYRGFHGRVLGQVSCTPALLAYETLVIDTATEQFVRYNAAGVATLVPTWNTTTNWPDFLPRDAQRELERWATVESTLYFGIVYRRNWEN